LKRGLFITFEGIDGAGKSTHLAWSADFLREQGVALTLTREPGGTPLGEKIRDLLLATQDKIHPETETLLMFCARRQHIEEVIRPALTRGECVLCDRFTDATFAYQGGGRGVEKSKIAALEAWVHAELQPDLTVLFDVSAKVGQERVAKIKSPDRFEREQADFFMRVREAYDERMRQSPQRFVRVDGTLPIGAIRQALAHHFNIAISRWRA